ncbi:MAG: hypothetical protein LBU56_03340 [Rickettsiales bacterium]|jgi:hypothetical protein|nr:hypothetical protein [Rickettsiales bacterium]
MQKYIFNIVCSEDTVGNDSKHKRIKLVGNQDDEEKTIKFCGPHIGLYDILRKESGQEFFQLWVEEAKYNFREGDFCDSWTDVRTRGGKGIPPEEVKLKVILDGDCEYKIAVSIEDNQWITLPKSSLFGENLNLKKYYNQELNLLKGEKFSQNNEGDYYIPKVMYGQTKICELQPLSFQCCIGDAKMFSWSSSSSSVVKDYKIAVEKNDAGELSIYLADEHEARLSHLGSVEKNL